MAIKSDIEISHIPVLLLTALGEENNILDGLSIGADEYLIKPFSVKYYGRISLICWQTGNCCA